MWRSLVAHSLWERRVAGSNPVIPTRVRGFASRAPLTLLPHSRGPSPRTPTVPLAPLGGPCQSPRDAVMPLPPVGGPCRSPPRAVVPLVPVGQPRHSPRGASGTREHPPSASHRRRSPTLARGSASCLPHQRPWRATATGTSRPGSRTAWPRPAPATPTTTTGRYRPTSTGSSTRTRSKRTRWRGRSRRTSRNNRHPLPRSTSSRKSSLGARAKTSSIGATKRSFVSSGTQAAACPRSRTSTWNATSTYNGEW
jgi:hypothetical protein